jgi:ATP-dependent DNA helicase RecG
MNLKEIIEAGESEITEFKTSLAEWRDVVETISAFSNRNGGRVFIGVTDDCGIVGSDIGKKTIEKLANQIKQNTDPVIHPSICVEAIDGKEGKQVIVVNVDSKVYWDGLVCEGAGAEDVDEERVRWFLKEARKERGVNISEDASIEEALMKLKVLRNGELTNAALLLFFKEPTFLQSEVKCIRFSGNEPIKPYIDFQTIEGTVFDLIDKTEDFVLRNIRKSIRLVSGEIQRAEKYEYPPDAIREAIVNAVAHRDYESPSKVQVRIFDDRIEVWSPGTLPTHIGASQSSLVQTTLLGKICGGCRRRNSGYDKPVQRMGDS